ncbi:hypothetical protein NQZ68_026013 [Dissostichus eleginoides]|nr:hypothetical protein NQZ68_026013 [Dissostichus eleginoides]
MSQAGNSGGIAFCAVTTLPPPEQAAAESREQLAGHRAAASPSLQENYRERGARAGQLCSFTSARATQSSNPIMMRLRLLSVINQRCVWGLLKMASVLHFTVNSAPSRLPVVTAGVPTPWIPKGEEGRWVGGWSHTVSVGQ